MGRGRWDHIQSNSKSFWADFWVENRDREKILSASICIRKHC